MPNFITYDVEYTNLKPFSASSAGPGKIRVSIIEGAKSIRGKIKHAVESKINSMGVRIDSFTEVKEQA